MNCPVVDIVGAEDGGWYYSDSKRVARDGNAGAVGNTNLAAHKALEKLPSLYVANLAGINSCTTKETTDVVDDPGEDVEYGDDSAGAQQTWSRVKRGSSRCTGAGKMASGGASSPLVSPSSSSDNSDPSWSDAQDSSGNDGTPSTPVSTDSGSGSTKPANCNDGQWHPECYSREPASSSSNLPKTNAEAKAEVDDAKQNSPEIEDNYPQPTKSPDSSTPQGSDKNWETYNPDYEYYYSDDNYPDDNEYAYDEGNSDYGTWNARRQQEPPPDISTDDSLTATRIGVLHGFSWPTRTTEDEPTVAVDVSETPVTPTPTDADAEPVIEPVIGDTTSTENPSMVEMTYTEDDVDNTWTTGFETSTQGEELTPTPIEPPTTDDLPYPTTHIPVDRPVPIISGVNDVPIPEITGFSSTVTDEIRVDPLRPTGDVSPTTITTNELFDHILDLISADDGNDGDGYDDWDDGFDSSNDFDPGWADPQQDWQSTDTPIDYEPQTGEFDPLARQIVNPEVGVVDLHQKASAWDPTPSVHRYHHLAPPSATSCSDPQWYCDGCSSPNRCVKINPCTRTCTRLPYTSTAAPDVPEVPTPDATVFPPALDAEAPNVSRPSSVPVAIGSTCGPSYVFDDLSPFLPCQPGTLLCKSPTQFYICGPFGPAGEWAYSEARDVAAGMKCEPALVSAGLAQAQRVSRMLRKKRQDDGSQGDGGDQGDQGDQGDRGDQSDQGDQGSDGADWYYVDVPDGENADNSTDWGVEGVDWYWDSSPSSPSPSSSSSSSAPPPHPQPLTSNPAPASPSPRASTRTYRIPPSASPPTTARRITTPSWRCLARSPRGTRIIGPRTICARWMRRVGVGVWSLVVVEMVVVLPLRLLLLLR